MERMGIIYGVYDRRDPTARVRYVGKTIGRLNVRANNHWTYSRRTGPKNRFHCWLASRTGERENVTFITLRSVAENELSQVEVETIQHYRSLNQADLNLTDGGEGLSGYSRSPESRLSMSEKYRTTGGPRATLNWDQVNDIRNARMQNYSTSSDLGRQYGVSRTIIDRILANSLWIDPGYDRAGLVKRPPGTGSRAAFSMSQAQSIRRLRQERWISSADLALEYGVSAAAVQHILENRSYRDPQYDPTTRIGYRESTHESR